MNNGVRRYASQDEVLTKINTVEYIPTEDYHPATKKYADDLINNIQSDVFVVSITSSTADDGTVTYSADKTYADILEARENDKMIIANFALANGSNRRLYLGLLNSAAASFVFLQNGTFYQVNIFTSGEVWVHETKALLQSINYNGLNTTDKTIIGAINELDTEFSSHNHDGVYYTQTETDALIANYYLKTEADILHTELHDYVDTEVAALVNSAPETLDTLGELATAFNENKEVVDALDEAITTKANQSDLNALSATVSSHTTVIDALKTETWTFTLNDGSTVTKQMVIK